MVGAGPLALLTVALGAATLTAPVTGGLSYGFAAAAAVPVATLSGIEIAVIIAVLAVGLKLLLDVFKNYEEVSYSNGNLVLKRRQGDNGSK